MHRTALTCTILATLGLVASVAPVAAGPITPPPGPVTSTHKTLSEVEPRIAMNATNTPGDADSVLKITKSGSYYLSADVATPSGKIGIEVDLNVAPEVTIDLNGFTLRGATGATYGILSNGFGHIEISGGTITGFAFDAMQLDCRDYRVEGVTFYGSLRGLNAGGWGRVSDCAFIEIADTALGTGTIAHVERCLFWDCGDGIVVPDSSFVADCRVVSSTRGGIIAGSSSVVRDCVSVANGGDAFLVGSHSTVTGCVASSSRVGFLVGEGTVHDSCVADGNTQEGFLAADACIFRACIASLNQLQGFRAGSAASFEHCTAFGNTGKGFYAGQKSTFANCHSTLGGAGGFESGPVSVFTDCVASENSGNSGFKALENSTFTGCRAYANAGRGFQTSSRTVLTNCQATSNSSFGFETADQSTLSGCLAASNAAGISGTDAVTVTGCTATNNTGRGIAVNNGCRVVDNLTRNNGLDGIFSNFSSEIVGNNCNGDGTAAGVQGAITVVGQANRVEGNNITYADRGLYITNSANVVTRNTVKGCTVNFDIVGGNDVGPIGSAATSTSPWANIQF